jgi:hypothetical protein
MELYLQFGYGMMTHCRSLISAWQGGTVILSPRDLAPQQLPRFSQSILDINNGACLLDPQFYLPYADHARLRSHDFWPTDFSTGSFFGGPTQRASLSSLATMNGELGCREMILPGRLATVIDSAWLEMQRVTLEEARAMDIKVPLYPTIALSGDAVRNNDQIGLLMDSAASWGADGYYLVCEHPQGNYLVNDPNWLANVLDIIAGLRLGGAKVILGYCNHQMLIAATAKVTAIASGTWMNVRSFPPDKFRTAYEEEDRRRTTWYYAPRALSEYKFPYLDIAQRFGLLPSMAPPPEMANDYVSPLFAGGQPSSIEVSETAIFRHYLTCLRVQTVAAERSGFNETIQAHEELLNEAEALLRTLTTAGVRGQQRDFFEIIDVNRAALSVLTQTRGAILRRQWPSL